MSPRASARPAHAGNATVAALLAAAGLAVFGAACSRPAAGAGAGPGASPPPRPVQLVPAGTAELPTKVGVSGVLAAQEELVLGLEVAGRLASLAVDVGDVVAADTVVAVLAPRDFELANARAAAAVAAAEARLGAAGGSGVDLDRFDVEAVPAVREAKAVVVEAKLRADRIATMVQEKLQPESELETASASLAVAENRLQRARDDVAMAFAEVRLRRIELQQAQKRLADSTVRAPWAGRVAQRHAAVGQVLAAGDPVVTLLRVDPLRLRLRVPDRLGMGIAPGQTVEFTVDGDPGTLHRGRVVRAGPAIERGDRTRLVEAEVGNPDGLLLPGAFCRAQVVTAKAVPVVAVPRSAVVSFAGVDRVFTVGEREQRPGRTGQGAAAPPPAASPPPGGKVAKGRVVTLGRNLGEQVEIVAGLAAGTPIVRDATGLQPETPVTVE